MNKKIKIFFCILLILSMLVSLSGCIQPTEPTSTAPATPAPASPTSEAKPSELPKDAEIVIKFAFNDSMIGILESSYYSYIQVFKQMVENKSGGRIAVQTFPNNQLGDLPSMLDQAVKGTIQMTAGQNTGLFATYAPNIQALDIPYVFRDTEVALKVLNGELGAKLSQELIEKAGIRIISYLPTSFRNFITNKKQIRVAADVKGLKIRTMEVPIHIKMMESLGANPTVISFAELYTAMQTGVVDGHEQAPYTVLMNKLEEVADYYTLDGHILNSNAVSINEKFFQSLSKEDQRIILSSARAAQQAMLGVIKAKEVQDLAKIAAAGVEIYQPTPEELEGFKEATQKSVIDMLKLEMDEAIISEMLKEVKKAEKELDSLKY